MTQVNRDNVLQVRNAIKQQMEELHRTLLIANLDAVVRPCGRDPISADATPQFNNKIRQVLKAHWEHHAELQEAVDRLTDSAYRYGYTEDDLERSFTRVEATS